MKNIFLIGSSSYIPNSEVYWKKILNIASLRFANYNDLLFNYEKYSYNSNLISLVFNQDLLDKKFSIKNKIKLIKDNLIKILEVNDNIYIFAY